MVSCRLRYMLDELELVQKANGEGYIGGVPGSKQYWKDLAGGEVGLIWKRWAPWYNVQKVNVEGSTLFACFGFQCPSSSSGKPFNVEWLHPPSIATTPTVTVVVHLS